MPSNIPFLFTTIPSPSISSEFEAEMPCYECTMLGYDMTCKDCSRFTFNTTTTPPSSPASGIAFSFNSPFPLRMTLPTLGTLFTPENLTSPTKQSHLNLPKLETAGLEAPSTKKSRFNWSEMDFSTSENPFEELSANHEDTVSSISDTESELYYNELDSNCTFCSMVPYGALCTNCERIQTSRAISLATPPAAAWPVMDKLGDLELTKAPEEELLQNFDMELFELINVPHELDEWGRRIYNDCGHRILYYQDADGNTVMGYEAWYPCSVTGEYEEPDEFRTGRRIHDSVVDEEAQISAYDYNGRRIINSADSDWNTVVLGYEDFEVLEDEHAAEQDDGHMVGFEQQRLIEFLAAQDEELPQFASDRQRIAAWIATSSVADDDGISILSHENCTPMVY